SLYTALICPRVIHSCVFFFNDSATTEIYTLSLHDALPILEARTSVERSEGRSSVMPPFTVVNSTPSLQLAWPSEATIEPFTVVADRKSTRLNSSHVEISYAVFCLKKKNNKQL